MLLSLFGGPALAQPAAAPLPLPASYTPRTPPPGKGIVNPAADRAPVKGGTGGRVMYFHKPSDATAPDPSPDLPAELAAVAAADAVRADERLALALSPAAAPSATPTSVPTELPPVAPVEAPAAPPAEASAPVETPTAADFPVPQVPAPAGGPAEEPFPPIRKTVQKKQELPKAGADIDPKVTQLPARASIFVVYDDTNLERAIIDSVRKDVRDRMKKANEKYSDDDRYYRFPDKAVLVPPGTQYESKTATYPPMTEYAEPGFVVHRRLHFEEKNAERAGWDLGPAQPIVSSLIFYKDVLFWPHSLASNPRQKWDTSAGKCLPGSPTPYYLYPPKATITGTAAEAGIITATAFILVP